MPLLTLLVFLNLLEQTVNVSFVVPCTTDEICMALNPHIEPY